MPREPGRRAFDRLLRDVRACRLCEEHLPHGVRPILRADPAARVLVAGQAPGRRVHATGVPFDDPSGDRLRDWMGVSREVFDDAARIAVLPMGFCYPGAGRSGDLPPRPECAEAWRRRLLDALPAIRLTLVLGRHALEWHVEGAAGRTLTDVVRGWRSLPPTVVPLPHPSPRNNRWLAAHPWFAAELLPALRRRVARALAPDRPRR